MSESEIPSYQTSTDSNSGNILFGVVNSITFGLPLVPLFLKKLANFSEYLHNITELESFDSIAEDLKEISESGLSSWSFVRDRFKEEVLEPDEESFTEPVIKDENSDLKDKMSTIKEITKEKYKSTPSTNCVPTSYDHLWSGKRKNSVIEL